MSTIKTLVFVWLLALLHISCSYSNSITPVEKSREPRDVFVFIDKSKSVAFTDPEVLSKTQKEVTLALNMLNREGDQLLIYYIHGNTGAISADQVFRIPAMKKKKGANKLERNKIRKAYVAEVKKQKTNMLQAIRSRLSLKNDSGTERATDIIGALEVVSRQANTAHITQVVILSDGIHTTNGLGNGSVKNNQEATTLAEAHLARLGQYYSIEWAALKNTKALMVLPYEALSSRHNKYLNDYWKRFFTSNGITIEFK